jgi:hypothetical protein
MIDTFPIVPAHSRALWVLLGVIMLAMLGAATMLLLTARGSTRSQFEVSAQGLRLKGDLYGRLLPAAALRFDEIRIVDLGVARELRPVVRTFGTGAPGYQSGWFRLQNGEKALLYLTDRRRVVYIPTTEGFSVLLSAQSPERLVDRLRELPRR